jgi:taurine dioxygenase
MKIQPLDSVIGARITNCSLQNRPDAHQVSEIEDALETFGVLVFPNQDISPAQQVAFSEAFAELELTELETARLDSHEEIFVVGNVGNALVTFAPNEPGGELEWHTDHIHLNTSARASLLYALEVPSRGGDTLFACMYSAFDQLPKTQQQLCETLVALHSGEGLELFLERQKLGNSAGSLTGCSYQQIRRPLVRKHPRSGRKALYFGNQITIGIEGWSDIESMRFIEDLTTHSCQIDFQYCHRWQAGDAVLWDNRRVLHAGTPYDTKNSRRCMHRTTWRETDEALAD